MAMTAMACRRCGKEGDAKEFPRWGKPGQNQGRWCRRCSSLYMAWTNMKSRIKNPKNPGYKNYGGRGITICEAWDASFEAFAKDIGRRPSKLHSIGRINNNGPYSPENCRWETAQEQARNTQRTVFLEVGGEKKCISAVIEEVGISRGVLYSRIKNGWSHEEVLNGRLATLPAAPLGWHRCPKCMHLKPLSEYYGNKVCYCKPCRNKYVVFRAKMRRDQIRAGMGLQPGERARKHGVVLNNGESWSIWFKINDAAEFIGICDAKLRYACQQGKVQCRAFSAKSSTSLRLYGAEVVRLKELHDAGLPLWGRKVYTHANEEKRQSSELRSLLRQLSELPVERLREIAGQEASR